jgi:hypothetical protein
METKKTKTVSTAFNWLIWMAPEQNVGCSPETQEGGGEWQRT